MRNTISFKTELGSTNRHYITTFSGVYTYHSNELSHRQELSVGQFQPFIGLSLPERNAHDFGLQCLQHLVRRKQHGLAGLRKRPEAIDGKDDLAALEVLQFRSHPDWGEDVEMQGVKETRKVSNGQGTDVWKEKVRTYCLICALVLLSLLPKMSWIMCSTSEADSSPLLSVSYRSNAKVSVMSTKIGQSTNL